MNAYVVAVFASPSPVVQSPPQCQCSGPGRAGPTPAPDSAPRFESGGLLHDSLHLQPPQSCGSHCCTFPGREQMIWHWRKCLFVNTSPGYINQVSVWNLKKKLNFVGIDKWHTFFLWLLFYDCLGLCAKKKAYNKLRWFKMYINLLLLLQKDNSSLGLALHFVKMTIPGPSLKENECRKKKPLWHPADIKHGLWFTSSLGLFI